MSVISAKKLNKAGRDAHRRALERLESRDDRELLQDAVDRYAWAVHTADAVREKWLAAGEPVTLAQTNGVEGEHPLLRAMQSAERHAAQMAAAIGLDAKAKNRGPGRPVGAVSAPDRAAAPPKLRMLRDAG